MLTPNDLSVVLQLVGRASIPIAEVPALWPTIQRLEAAAKSRLAYMPAGVDGVDVPANPGGSE